MKKILIGLLTFGSLASFAGETLKIYPSDITKVEPRKGIIVAEMIDGKTGEYSTVTSTYGADKDCIELAAKLALSSGSTMKLVFETNTKFRLSEDKKKVYAYDNGNVDLVTCSLQN